MLWNVIISYLRDSSTEEKELATPERQATVAKDSLLEQDYSRSHQYVDLLPLKSDMKAQVPSFRVVKPAVDVSEINDPFSGHLINAARPA